MIPGTIGRGMVSCAGPYLEQGQQRGRTGGRDFLFREGDLYPSVRRAGTGHFSPVHLVAYNLDRNGA